MPSRLRWNLPSYFVEQNANEDRAELVDRLDRMEAMLKQLTEAAE
jgi:hypothetical protein